MHEYDYGWGHHHSGAASYDLGWLVILVLFLIVVLGIMTFLSYVNYYNPDRCSNWSEQARPYHPNVVVAPGAPGQPGEKVVPGIPLAIDGRSVAGYMHPSMSMSKQIDVSNFFKKS